MTEIKTTITQMKDQVETLIEPAVSQSSVSSFSFHPELLWMAGVLLVSFILLRSTLLLHLRIKDEAEECTDERIANFTNPYKIKPVILPQLTSPALPLFHKNLLLLPKEIKQFNDKEVELMLRHEMNHIKYHHRFISCILLILKIFYWFNPLVWIMSSKIHQEMEMMCDEQIVQEHEEDIALYGSLLIQMQGKLNSFEGIALSKHAQNTKERLGNLMVKKNKSTISIIAVVLVLSLSMIPLLAQQEQKTPNTNQTSKYTSFQSTKELDQHSGTSQRPQELTPEEFISLMVQPVDAFEITCPWGCYAGHEAMDVINPNDRYGNVYAVYSGIIIDTGYDSNHGNYIVIDHLNGYQTRYHHLNDIYVTINQEVNQKDILGLIGETGLATAPHLHLQLVFEGTSINIDSLFEE